MKLQKLLMVALVGAVVGLIGTGDFRPPNAQGPSVLTVCLGCTYGSIQAAVDAAKPGDIVEVHYSASPWPPLYPEKVTISKPITLQAKADDERVTVPYEISLLPRYAPNQPSLAGQIILNITAESGQVIIRGFAFRGGWISWSGRADLLLERNRFESISPWGTAGVKLTGSGSANLIENEFKEGMVSLSSAMARAHLKFNRIRSSHDFAITISGGGAVVLDQNFIEGGGILVGRGTQVRLEGNILVGGLGFAGRQAPEYGIVFVDDRFDEQGNPQPITVEVHHNVIVRYQKGVAIGYRCDAAQLLQISGQLNIIEQNGQDLCPADYPWPPGFRK